MPEETVEVGMEATDSGEGATDGVSEAADGVVDLAAAPAADVATLPQSVGFDEVLAIILAKLADWWRELVAMIPNLVISIILLLVAVLVARYASRGTLRLARRLFDSVVLATLCATLAKLAVYCVGIFVALSVLQLDKTVTSLLAGAGIIGLALGFAFQDLAANFLAGIIMGVRKPFAMDEIVATGDYIGTIRGMNLRNTILENFEGQRVIIPNKQVFESPLVNYSRTGYRRFDIDVGVAYGSDLEQVGRVLREVIADLDWLHPEKGGEAWCRGFGDSSINWTVFLWVAYPDGPKGYFDIFDTGVKAIKRAFDREGIVIPFPIRTLDLPQDLAWPGREDGPAPPDGAGSEGG